MLVLPLSSDNMSLSILLKNKMDDIELDNLGGDRIPLEEEDGEETNVYTDWRDESVIKLDGSMEEEKNADRELGKKIGAMRRSYMEDKKNLLRELPIDINKGDGPFAKEIFEKLSDVQ